MKKTIKIVAAGLEFSQENGYIRIDNQPADLIHWTGPEDAGYDVLMQLFHETRAPQKQLEPLLTGLEGEELAREEADAKSQEAAARRPPIVCLCGSTRFGTTFHEANLRETLAGHIVLSIGCNLKSDTDLLLAGEITSDDKACLDELHLRKIDLADEILVLNVEGYIGESTGREISYAVAQNKPIRWWEPLQPDAWDRLSTFVSEHAWQRIAHAEWIRLSSGNNEWKPEQMYQQPDLRTRYVRMVRAAVCQSDQEAIDGYRENLRKLKALGQFGRASEHFRGYPNILRMNLCLRELERRGLPIPRAELNLE